MKNYDYYLANDIEFLLNQGTEIIKDIALYSSDAEEVFKKWGKRL